LGNIERVTSAYKPVHMVAKKWRLAFAATNVASVNQQVQADAAAAGVLCCRCDEVEEGDFAGGAMRRIGAVTMLAVGTSSGSPALAARMRDQAATSIRPVSALQAELMVQWRARVKAEVEDTRARRDLLKRLAGEEIEEQLLKHGVERAQELFEQLLALSVKGQSERSDGQ
jgi:siroheme synthase-like protein